MAAVKRRRKKKKKPRVVSCESVAGGTVIRTGFQSIAPPAKTARSHARPTSQTHNLAQMVVETRPDNDGRN